MHLARRWGAISVLKALNINGKRFSLIAGISSAVFIVIAAIMLLARPTFAAFPIAGVGGFVIDAQRITGTNLNIYTDMGPTSLHENWGQARIEIGSVNITGLKLVKNIDLKGALSQYDISELEVLVTPREGVTVSGSQVKLKVTAILATNSSFTNLKIQENRNASRPIDVFHLNASNFTLDGPELNSHFMSAGTITIPGLNVKLRLIKNDGTKIDL